MSDAKVTAVAANRIAFANIAYYRDTPDRPGGAVRFGCSDCELAACAIQQL
ncbi:hypothetical protein [Methylobacterium sp. V23]|uniref:hypothetical protein n=1 Tax=Methylobacterium sp. V23 TaxID=2044878 RepID=UPI0015E16E7C|nr:hypothetical protein [Methylobacterium sp. V23]